MEIVRLGSPSYASSSLKLIKLRKSCSQAQRLFYSLKLIKLKQVVELTLNTFSTYKDLFLFFPINEDGQMKNPYK